MPAYSSNFNGPDSNQPVRVLVVDDSAFLRYTISQYLNQIEGIVVVGTASDGVEALVVIPELQPDVVTLDVEMPNLDGISTLRQIMLRFPRPVIMLSSLTKNGAVETIQALTLGAVDFVGKPDNRLNIRSVMEEVAAKILRAVQARVKPASLVGLNLAPLPPVVKSGPGLRPRQKNDPIVLIGTSTGGPRALNEVIPALPASLGAAVVVVQHMPAGFTHSLAERLNSLAKLKVKEAQTGDGLEVGQVLIAPGGFHLLFDDREQVSLTQTPPVHGVRPAVDVTLTSLVERFGKKVIAVILTGMGSDGTNGANLLRSLGGTVIAEHESTCIVWGMPRSVTEKGLASQIVPLPEAAKAIEEAVQSQRLSARTVD